MRTVKGMRKWHRWVATIVGLQLLLWTLSGLIFTLEEMEVVRGEAFLIEAPHREFASSMPLVPLAEAWRAADLESARSVGLRHLRERDVWVFEGHDSSVTLIDGASGERLAELTAEEAATIATARFDDGRTIAIERVIEATGEYRGNPVPAWRVTMDDDRNTHVYVHPTTGAITSVRNDTWRRFDFFWMLHVMDYEEREDFHHPLITIAAIGGVLTSLTGLVLAVMLWWARRRSATSKSADR